MQKYQKYSVMIMAMLLSLAMVMGLAACTPANDTDNGDATTTATPTSGVQSTPEPATKTNIRIVGLKGPTGLGMSKLMAENEAGTAANNYTFTLSSATDEVSAMVVKGEVDIAAVPTNLAANLYQKTNGQWQLAALNTLGVLYIMENGNTINNIQDLKGKTIYASGAGATPQYILEFILKQNDIDPEKDLTIHWSSEHSEVVALCASNQASIALLPEPNVTTLQTKNADFRIALDITAEYEAACTAAGIKDNFLSMGCVIVNKEFAENNPEAVASFMTEYKASIEYVNANVDAAATLAVKYEIIGAEAIAKKAIPNCNITFISGAEMKTGIKQFYQVLFDANPKSVGGSLPDDDFYYAG